MTFIGPCLAHRRPRFALQVKSWTQNTASRMLAATHRSDPCVSFDEGEITLAWAIPTSE